jgi:hypothetical protein
MHTLTPEQNAQTRRKGLRHKKTPTPKGNARTKKERSRRKKTLTPTETAHTKRKPPHQKKTLTSEENTHTPHAAQVMGDDLSTVGPIDEQFWQDKVSPDTKLQTLAPKA